MNCHAYMLETKAISTDQVCELEHDLSDEKQMIMGF